MVAEETPVQRAERNDRLAFWLLTIFVTCIYVAPTEWIPGAAALRLQLITSSLATGLIALNWLRPGRRPTLDGIRGWSMLGFCALAFASTAWSVFPDASRGAAIELTKLWVSYIVLVSVVTTPRRLAILAGAMVLGSIVTSIGTLHWYVVGQDLVEGYRARWIGVFADPNRMAMSVEIVIPLAVAFLMKKGASPVMKLGSLVALGVGVAAIVVSYSRGGFLGISVALLTWVILERKPTQFVAVGILAVALLIFAPNTYWNRAETTAGFQEDASAMGRVHAWAVASNISRDRPMLGTGAGTFRIAWPLYAPPDAPHAYEAHNIFVQTIGEFGFVGLLLWLMFLGGATEGAFTLGRRHREEGWLGRGVAAALVGHLVCNLFAGFLVSPLLFVVIGLAGACSKIEALLAQERKPELSIPAATASAPQVPVLPSGV